MILKFTILIFVNLGENPTFLGLNQAFEGKTSRAQATRKSP
jgi:hypothetical protein